MSQTQIASQILYRHNKGIVADLEKQLGCGSSTNVVPEVERVYEQYKANVAVLQKRLGKTKGASK